MMTEEEELLTKVYDAIIDLIDEALLVEEKQIVIYVIDFVMVEQIIRDCFEKDFWIRHQVPALIEMRHRGNSNKQLKVLMSRV